MSSPSPARSVSAVMLWVAGKRFVCECGASVFSKLDGEYRCNGCDRRYA